MLSISLDFNFIPLLVVLAVGWSVPMIISILHVRRIPSVLLEILTGYILGVFFLKYVDAQSMTVLEFLALTGLVFIMFLSGLEIDINRILASMPRKREGIVHYSSNPLLSGIVHYLICLAISYAGTYLLSFYVDIPNVWFFSLIPTATFMGIVYPVLKNRGETRGHYGQTLITTSAVADIASITLITISSLYIKFGLGLELLYIVFFFLFFILVYFLARRIPATLFRRITFQHAHAATQINIRGSMALVILFVVIAQFVGGEVVILGAFLSGLLMSFFMNKERSLLIIKLEGMGFGFFIPIFFIMVGAKFSPASLLEYGHSVYLFLALLLILFYVVKIIPSFIWLKIFGMKKTLAAGSLLAVRLGLVIAASSVGLTLGVITPGANAGFIIMVILTCFVSPILYDVLHKKHEFLDDKVIIAGGSSVAVLLARRLKLHGRSAIIIEKNSDRFDDIKQKGLQVVLGDAGDPEVYRKINITPGNHVVVYTNSDEKNLEICTMLRKDLLHERIISKPENSRMETTMRLLNVEILDARRVLAAAIENLILRPSTYHSLAESFENYLVEEITVTSISLNGKKIMEIPFDKEGMLILIRRGSAKDIPHGDYYIRTGDIITVFGTAGALESIRSLVQS